MRVKKISLASPVGSSDVTKAVKKYKSFLKNGTNGFTLEKLKARIDEIISEKLKHQEFVFSTKLIVSSGYRESELKNARNSIVNKVNEFFRLQDGSMDYINGTDKFKKL